MTVPGNGEPDHGPITRHAAMRRTCIGSQLQAPTPPTRSRPGHGTPARERNAPSTSQWSRNRSSTLDAIHVGVDKPRRGPRLDRMFSDLASVAGGVNRWSHGREMAGIVVSLWISSAVGDDRGSCFSGDGHWHGAGGTLVARMGDGPEALDGHVDAERQLPEKIGMTQSLTARRPAR